MRIARSSTVINSSVAVAIDDDDDDEEVDVVCDHNLERKKVERKDEDFPILVVARNASHGEYSCSQTNRMATARFHRDDKIVMVVYVVSLVVEVGSPECWEDR
jgi:hypothetical protein